MTNFKTKILSLALAACMLCVMSVSASAAEINQSGGSGTTPVNLTTTNDGIGGDGGEFTPTKLNVVVPTSLPMAMSDDGTVVTASDCKIVNKSYGAVRVKSVTISAADEWNLTAFGDKSTLAGEKVDSNKLGFALSIGGGKQVKTNSDNATQQLITDPIDGCYMTGIGDTANNFVMIDYDAIVTPLSGAVNNATVANVVFVIEWDMVA
ncbi:MAG: hypothetical protein IJ325_09500 [Clostridia bacterium]|nr:hypothetical protein [Clostridia bacterium]